MKKLFIFAAILLAGCAASGVQVTAEQAASFQIGIATEADIVQKLGRPNAVHSSSSGGKMLIYSYAQAQARPATFIPIVGAFAGGADVRSSAAVFTLDSNGKLLRQNPSSSEYGTGTGFAGGPAMQQTDQPR